MREHYDQIERFFADIVREGQSAGYFTRRWTRACPRGN